MKALEMFLNWQRLPEALQHWLFSTGTKAVEIISGLGLIGYALVFWVNGDALLSEPIYYKFDRLPIPVSVGVFVLTGLLLLAASGLSALDTRRFNRQRADTVSGYLLIFSGFLWFLVSAAFISNAPPLNTGMILTGILAAVSALGGHNLIIRAHRKQKGKGV